MYMPLFEKKFKGHVRTVPGNVHVEFEVLSSNCFEAISNTHKFRGQWSCDPGDAPFSKNEPERYVSLRRNGFQYK